MPCTLIFEVLGPIIETAGYVVSVLAFALGFISIEAFVSFLALAFLYGLVLSIGAVVMEDATFGRNPGWRSLGRILTYAVAENLGYRQLTNVWKIESLYTLWRGGGWGTMERRGLSRQVEDSLAGEVGMR